MSLARSALARHPRQPRPAPPRALALALALLAPAAAQAAHTPVSIVVQGVSEGPKENIENTLSLAREAKRAKLSEVQVRNLHDKAPQEIRIALEPFGFYRPIIETDLAQRRGRWVATYVVDPGPAVKIDSVDVSVTGEGAADPKVQKALADFPLHKGDVLDHQAWGRGKRAFVEAAAGGGFLDADFTAQQVQVDVDTYAARVILHFDTGPRYLFGPVTFDQDVLSPRLLNGYARWKQGDPFDFKKLLAMQSALGQSPYFSRVEVDARREAAVGREVPVVVVLEPARRTRYTAGLGYGTDNGAHGRAGVEVRRVNRMGQRADVDVQLAQFQSGVTGHYMLPWPYPRTDLLTLSAGYQDDRSITQRGRATRGGVSWARNWWIWRETLALSYHLEKFTVGPDVGNSRFLMPEATFEETRADNRLDPRRGHKVALEARGADQSVLSDASFLQLVAHGKAVVPIGPMDRFITRLDLGHTVTNRFRALPPSLRFFAGGAQSVRGYRYQSLGEVDSTGRVIGGWDLVVGSVELEHRFVRNWGVAAFLDAGNALTQLKGSLKRGAGAGLRWISPVGMVRFDVGFALDDTRGQSRTQIHVTVGPDL